MTQADAPAPAAAKPLRARFDRYELDEENATLACDGKSIPLPPTPFAVLCALVRQQGTLVTKNSLLDEVWGHRFVTESVLKTVIGKVRTALQDDARQPRFIETVSRRGYRFIAATVPGVQPQRGGTSRAPAADDDTFIGRADELERLHAAWDEACAGKRSIVWLAGDPGIGKTTLMQRFIANLADVPCVRGQCVEQYGAGEPYLPVLEALGPLCRRDPSLLPLLRSVAPTWLLQLPWLLAPEERDALRRELAGVGPDRMLREFGELVDRHTERAPLLLVTEDLQWSDRSTIQLLNYIARRPGTAHLMWLATFRLSEVVALDHPLNPLRRELRLHRLCDEIVLDPFSESEVERYVGRRSPAAAADEAFVRALHERTDGVPLFVSHILADLLHGANDGEPAQQITRMAIPENLVAIIDHYVAKLSAEHRELLSAAAVLGVDFDVRRLAEVLDRDVALVAETCDALLREQLWLAACRASERDDDTAPAAYSFKHALFHQVVYERTSVLVRSDLHRRAGLALERARAAGASVAAAKLAVHFDRAREPMSAMRYYAEAAEAALMHFSPTEAAALTARGLALVPQAPESPARDDLEFTLATLDGVSAAHLHAFSSDAAKAAYSRGYALLARVPDHRFRGLLLHGLGLALFLRAEYAEALAFAQRCADIADERGDPELLVGACDMRSEVGLLQGRPGEGREWAERGLAVIEAMASPSPEIAASKVTLLGLLGLHLLHLGHVEEARDAIRRARACADEWDRPMAQTIALWIDALIEVRLGETQRVAAVADAMQQLVEKHGLAQGRAACRWFRGWAQARSGQPREGYARIMEAYAENTQLGMLSGGSEVLGYACEALLIAGDLDGAAQRLEEALAIARNLEERVYLPQLFGLEAAIARARGKPAQAAASMRRAVEEAHSQEARWLEKHAAMMAETAVRHSSGSAGGLPS
jgi:DNA-binding winged helix-turn-helix (wHTH) protein/tetratricopeptide (TPR) repeat protein